MKKLLSFGRGGVHPRENKLTASQPARPLGLPIDEYGLLVSHHIGAPAQPLVAKGDHVEAGQAVAGPSGFVSAPVHTPVSGTVSRIDQTLTPMGTPCLAIFIKPDAEQPAEPVKLQQGATTAETVARAGVVGLGGATFPTAVKLALPPGKKADTVVINGAECEPYLTCDHALMLMEPDLIVRGTELIMEASGAPRAVIAIEANKPDAIKLLKGAVKGHPGVEVAALRPRYPQGGEKQLIKAVTGREVPSGGLPIDVGVVVQNVATAHAVARAVDHGEPLTERIVTVTGPGVERPGNYLVKIGTPLKKLIEAAGGLPADTGKVIMGGPMMGRAAQTLDSYTTKGLGGILVLPESMARRGDTEPCIRCARCVSACPMGLEPYLISTLSRLGDFAEARTQKVANCIECGCCSYVCPSHRPLLDYIRIGKARALAAARAERQASSQQKK